MWALLCSACVLHEPTPLYRQTGPAGGYAPRDFDTASACGAWRLSTTDSDAYRHVAFAEQSPEACYARVRYDGERIVGVDAPTSSCAYPRAADVAALRERAAVYERVARAEGELAKLPLELSCELPPEVRRAAARANARTLRSYVDAAEKASEGAYPYAVAATFGYGSSEQDQSTLMGWLPGAPCHPLDHTERARLSVNNLRAARAAEAYHAGVAPFVMGSGGAVHAGLVEAFMLGHLMVCEGGVPADRVLYDPCADHTHTNMRNVGAVIAGMGARTGYVVTDSFLQGDYLQDQAGFEWIGGSVDERALRDWGHLIGAWRRASVGMDAGFWMTPYRFWADPSPSLASFHCVGDRALGAPH